MRFYIYRTSDSFRTVPLPNLSVRPHENAQWDEGELDWVINLHSLENLIDLCRGNARIVITKQGKTCLEIDDVTLNQ